MMDGFVLDYDGTNNKLEMVRLANMGLRDPLFSQKRMKKKAT